MFNNTISDDFDVISVHLAQVRVTKKITKFHFVSHRAPEKRGYTVYTLYPPFLRRSMSKKVIFCDFLGYAYLSKMNGNDVEIIRNRVIEHFPLSIFYETCFLNVFSILLNVAHVGGMLETSHFTQFLCYSYLSKRK